MVTRFPETSKLVTTKVVPQLAGRTSAAVPSKPQLCGSPWTGLGLGFRVRVRVRVRAIRNVPNSVPNGQIQSQKSPIRGFYVPGGPITSREFRSPKVSGTSSSLPLRPGDAAERRTTSRGRLARPEIFRPRKFSGRPRTHLYVPGT